MTWKDYITEIVLSHVRNIPPCSILLSKEHRSHLIVTGPNGSGKTTLVNDLYRSLNLNLGILWNFVTEAKKKGFNTLEEIYQYYIANSQGLFGKQLIGIETKQKDLPLYTDLSMNPLYYLAKDNKDFFIYFSEAHRKENFQKPEGPHALKKGATGNQFLQLMVNFKTQQAYLYEDINRESDTSKKAKLEKEYEQYKNWFKKLDKALSKLLGHKNFKIEYEREKYNFLIVEDGKAPYEFKQLSDGYAAILKVMTDIMLEMSDQPVSEYQKPGIAIIDEIETHLHVELQQKILPFLTELFPNVQFVVTTHSPFVLSSISDVKIFDIATQTTYDSFTQYSYSNIVEGYFNVSQFSNEIIEDFKQAEIILQKDSFTESDKTFLIVFDKKVNTSIDNGKPLQLKRKWLDLKIKNREKLYDIF